ncbi:hypothetical protein VaNZ11_017140 [Volvox africanus]|uniref:Uncharacterized protein n=1 Tax=Volvox africanus TaxID=51714 RepID=A0ABQ5SR23_9CHLO|nr:hypothetical protein VaNZ11_017140 [Volvox africanus]
MKALLPCVLGHIERVIARHVTLDGRTGLLCFDPLCNLFTPRRPLSSIDLSNHVVLFIPSSLREISEQLAVYRRCRRQYPGTAACVLLPAFCRCKAEASLRGMRRVHRFEPGTVLFNGVDREGMLAPWPGTSYSVDVWYEAPDEGSVWLRTRPKSTNVICWAVACR